MFSLLMEKSPVNDRPQLSGPVEPASDSDWAAYYDLRWRVLREPWAQPRGSERDELDPTSFHLAFKTADGRIVAGGRLHLNSATQGQVRYMAVDSSWRRDSLGSRILRALESRARDQGATEIVLNARKEVTPFYLRHGYRIVGEAPLLFGTIPHFRMQKDLSAHKLSL